MTYEELIGLPFNKQVNETVKLYLRVNNLPIYVNSKPSTDYFKARAYFMGTKCMIPRQHIKNVWKWLNDKKQKCSLYKLCDFANHYVAECQSEKERQKVKELGVKQHDIGDFLEDFLND